MVTIFIVAWLSHNNGLELIFVNKASTSVHFNNYPSWRESDSARFLACAVLSPEIFFFPDSHATGLTLYVNMAPGIYFISTLSEANYASLNISINSVKVATFSSGLYKMPCPLLFCKHLPASLRNLQYHFFGSCDTAPSRLTINFRSGLFQ